MQIKGSEVLGHPHLYMKFSVIQAMSDPVFRRRQGVGCGMDVAYSCCSPGHFKKDLDPDWGKLGDKAWPVEKVSDKEKQRLGSVIGGPDVLEAGQHL